MMDTFEDPNVIDPPESEKLFGQSDHLRVYMDLTLKIV